MRSSASESGSRSAPGGSSPSTWSTASVDLRRNQISGAASVKNARTGADTQSAVPSACPSATPFGTSSPITTWKKVRIRYARRTASTVAINVSNAFESACSPSAPMPSEVSVTPSCIAVMNCDGSLVILQHRPRAPVALVVELDDPRAARRDERVLGRDEEAVEQHEQPDADQLESECHAPAPEGARY